MASTAALAKTLRALHIPGKPLVLTNIYDAASARAIASLPGTRALATASFAVASAAGVEDEHLTLEQNLSVANAIATVAHEHKLPLTVDFQDGYGDRLEEGVAKLIDLGVVGINLEDCRREGEVMIPLKEAAERVARVMAVAREKAVEDFVVNARADSMIRGGTFADVIERGKAYLAAGATTVFVLGGSEAGVLSAEDVRQLLTAFDGRMSAPLRIKAGNRTVKEWAELGVARLSIGPQLQFLIMKKLAEEADKLLSQEKGSL